MKPWTTTELALLTANYADSRTDDLAVALGRSMTTVYQKANTLGLRKSEAYFAGDNAGRVKFGRQDPRMKASQFKPGQPAWNKGTKGIVGVQEACRATQFKKGRSASEARNYLPIGTQRITKDGNLEQKVTDDPSVYPARRCAAQGYDLLNADVHDREAHALSLLGVRCILTEAETSRGRSRLMNQIAKDVRQIIVQEATS